MLKTVWVYWLGVWLIGPFDSYGACYQARQYEIENGANEQVSICYQWEWEVAH